MNVSGDFASEFEVAGLAEIDVVPHSSGRRQFMITSF